MFTGVERVTFVRPCCEQYAARRLTISKQRLQSQGIRLIPVLMLGDIHPGINITAGRVIMRITLGNTVGHKSNITRSFIELDQ